MNKPLDKSEIKRLLVPLTSMLDENQFDYWLCGGVLEEIHKNKDILERHSDIDIHIMESDVDALCDLFMVLRNESLRDFNEPHRESYKITLVRDPLETDSRQLIIEAMILKEDNAGLYYNQYRSANIYVPRECFTGYQLVDIDGIQARAPFQIGDYLKAVEH